MANINRVVLSGNLTRDPELRQTPSGTGVLSFGVASNDRRRNQQTGEYEEVANYVDCTLFGDRAEPLSRILAKGMKVVVEGRLHYDSWERDGERHYKLEVVVTEVDLPQRQAQQQPQPAAQFPQPQYQQPAQPQQFPQPQPAAYQQPAAASYQQPAAASYQQQAGLYDESIPF